MSRRGLLRCYGLLWLATLAGAALARAGVRLAPTSAPRDALPERLTTTLSLLTHNAVVVIWPIALIALGWSTLTAVRSVGDILITGQLVSHGLIVGCALGQHPGTWRYLPHLPLEWLALAIPAGAWLTARTRPQSDPAVGVAELALPTAGCGAALVAAALLETYLVPLP